MTDIAIMSDQSETEEIYRNENPMDDSSDNDLSESTRKSSHLRNTVYRTMLPKNFADLKKFLDPSECLDNKSHCLTSQFMKKESAETLKVFREISYMKFKKISSEEESRCSKESHVDTEDSGLLKDGYVFERKAQPISKDVVNKKVKKWKKAASKQLEKVNKMYKHGRSKNKEIFSVPMGLEANRKIAGDIPDDSSCKSQSTILGQYNTEEEMDIRRNDEFMREVRRVLRCKKRPQTLEKRSLPEEYSRLIFKKTALLRSRDRQIALEEKGEPVTENTDTGADGDNNSEPATGIFEQLSKMVLKSKITRKSKAAQQRNEVLRTFEGKICDDIDNSEIDEKRGNNRKNEITKNEFVSQPGPSSEVRMSDHLKNQETIENYGELQIAKPDEFLNLPNLKDDKKCRLKKVESYLSSVADVQPVNAALPEISELTTEREQLLFDSLSGEFLKNMATGNERKYKITRNDKKLLAIIVKRYIDRGALGQIDELMNANFNEKILNLPPYENVTDREEFFLKKIIKKFIRRGMRDTLEDLIAWIYYKLDTRKTKQQDKQEQIWDENAVKRMVNAFNNSGKNPSLNRIVTQLLREHKEIYPGLSARQIGAVEEMIKNLVIERFARVYLEQTKMDVDQNSEPHTLAVSVKNEFKMNSGKEHFDVNGRYIEIKWKHTSLQDDSEQPNTEHETDEDSLIDGKSSYRVIEPELPNHNRKSICPEPHKEAKFVNERLKDIVWEVQQSYHRNKAGKANRTCSLVKKRYVTMIGDLTKSGKSNGKLLERKMDFEERRKQMREEHVKWLLEQKEILRDAKKKEAKNIEKFTQALPKRLENMIARRNRSLKKFESRSTIDMNNFTAKFQKK